MAVRQIMKKILIPGAAAVGVAAGQSAGQCVKCSECKCKPSELPIYNLDCKGCKPVLSEKAASDLENAIGKVRSELWVWQDGLQDYKQQVVDHVQTGIAHCSSSVDFLREESHGPERGGAIGLATLSGFILGLRGGIIKRLTYATVSGLGMGAVCYPREASEYTDVALAEANKYFIAGYHFVFGESPKVPEWAADLLATVKKTDKQATSKET